MTNSPNNNEKRIGLNESRLIPFTVAGIVCFGLALILGITTWYVFGTNRRLKPEKESAAVQTSNRNSGAAIENSNLTFNAAASPTPSATPAPEIKKAPAGELPVEGGEAMLGGGNTKLPLRRVAVAPFAVGETEVTNAQYAEFVAETKYPAPSGWKNDKFPEAAADNPVVGVSWADANAYCEWLSKKIGASARLPNEAEWEMAARGKTDFKYPWGNQWNAEAADSAETGGRVRPVKSFPKGRAPSGAFDMIGNVYEWTSDLYVDESGDPILFEKTKQRVIKGGSVRDRQDYLKIAIREGRPENKPSDLIGFRYVIIRK